MSAAHTVAVAVVFTWLGMVMAISFIEAPLKFRAPGVSLQIGLGIGRLVFHALNTVEGILAVPLLIAIGYDPPGLAVGIAVAVVIVTLLAQLLVVRPRLRDRSDIVLATTSTAVALPNGSSRRSRAHYGYVGLESVKAVALLVAGVTLLGL